jgi:hypothetical protein
MRKFLPCIEAKVLLPWSQLPAILVQLNPIHNLPHCFFTIYFKTVLSVTSQVFIVISSFRIWNKILHALKISPTDATRCNHVIVFDLVLTERKNYGLRNETINYVLCTKYFYWSVHTNCITDLHLKKFFLHSYATSPLLGPNIFLRTLFTNTLVFLKVRDLLLHCT